MKSVSAIGLGAMGSVLAQVLLQNGYRVTVWNRSVEKAAELVEAGASRASSPSEAVRASDATITCIRSHVDTRHLLEADPSALSEKTIIELSTGDSAEAASLLTWLRSKGAKGLIGMIAIFPKDIGKPDSAILAVGEEAVWGQCEALLTTLAGASARVGSDPIALAAIYASLVLPRQGFMFGMIYGAMICEKAGISMDAYVEALPLTIKIVHDYYELFSKTVPGGKFDDPPASLSVYHAAFEDVLRTCGNLGAPDELPRLLRDLLKRGMEAGLGDRQVTSLTRLLAEV
jgi:3-hydroxyisobutyrate dehydrogenase-like beta-hydroxyacid dehydrogenase